MFYASLVSVKGKIVSSETMSRGVKIPFTRVVLSQFMGGIANPNDYIKFGYFDVDTLIQDLAPGKVWTDKKAFKVVGMQNFPRLLHYINVHSFMVISNRSKVRQK